VPTNLNNHIRTGVRFLGVGVVNTAVGLGLIYACKWFLELGDVFANFIGYGVGIVVSFTLNRRWTFRHEGAVHSAFFRFIFVTALAYMVNLSVVLCLIHGLGINSYLAQAGGVIPYTLVGYIGSRYFAFRPK
jgi:putative flippase GtrA